jgi:hypothetical protein
MSRHKRFIITLALGVLILAVLCNMPVTRTARAAATPDGPAPQSVVGQWRGFFEDVAQTDYQPFVSLNITTQAARRFDGALEVAGCDGSVRVEGTIAASDNVSFLTQSSEIHSVVGKSRLHDFGGGGAILNGRLTLRCFGGARREGTLVLLRNFQTPPDPIIPSLTGDWRGTYTSEVNGVTADMAARFARSHRDPAVNSYIAEVTIIPCIFPQALASVSSDGRVIVIAQGVGEHVILQATLVQDEGEIDPCVRGTYQMEHDDGLQDFGSFDIKKVVS